MTMKIKFLMTLAVTLCTCSLNMYN